MRKLLKLFRERFRLLATAGAAGAFSLAGAVAAFAVMPQEDRWDSRHISLLPAEIRASLTSKEQACGNPLAAEHTFSLFLEGGSPRYRFIALHFEHLLCRDHGAVCEGRGCLHEIFASSGGPYRLVLRMFVPEIEMAMIGSRPALKLGCDFSGSSCQRILYWTGSLFAK